MITIDAPTIGAIAAGIVLVGNFGMTVVNWWDQRELKRLSLNRDTQIKEVKDLVNGRSEQLQTFVAKEAYEKGRMHERVAPGTPSPDIAAVDLKTVVTAINSQPGGVSQDARQQAQVPAPPAQPTASGS